MVKQSKGAALIIVLFIASILASVSALLLVKTKQHTQRISIAKEYMQAERNSLTDLNHFIFVTQTSPYSIIGDNSAIPISRDALPNNINLRGIPFEFRSSIFSVQDMSGLIPINPLDRAQLTNYLLHQEWPKDQIFKFLDTLEDWRDPDTLERVNGAESRKYSIAGYPLNQPIQTLKEFGLLANLDSRLIEKLSFDENLLVYGSGRTTLDYTPDLLLPFFMPKLEAENLITKREKQLQLNGDLSVSNYSSGNWIIKVKTGYGEAKSSKMLHLTRRFGGARPFVLSNWRERY